MIIKIADHYGLCFGVRDALQQAESIAQQTPLTILGELVHNPLVRERLAVHGVQERPLAEPGSASTAQVMITAHGASDRDRQAWSSAGFTVADGTCPLVRHAHERLRALVEKGFFPVVIGQRGHAEVQGLTGDFPHAVILETCADVTTLDFHPSFGVISQTTQRLDHVQAIVAAIRARFPDAEVRFCDTICKPTKDRQDALQRLLGEVDTMVVVGGRNSNNTRELVWRCEAAGRRTFHIERPAELRPEWFIGSERIGLTGGTSTLRETVAAVRRCLEEFALTPIKSGS